MHMYDVFEISCCEKPSSSFETGRSNNQGLSSQAIFESFYLCAYILKWLAEHKKLPDMSGFLYISCNLFLIKLSRSLKEWLPSPVVITQHGWLPVLEGTSCTPGFMHVLLLLGYYCGWRRNSTPPIWLDKFSFPFQSSLRTYYVCG